MGVMPDNRLDLVATLATFVVTALGERLVPGASVHSGSIGAARADRSQALGPSNTHTTCLDTVNGRVHDALLKPATGHAHTLRLQSDNAAWPTPSFSVMPFPKGHPTNSRSKDPTTCRRTDP